MYFENGPYIFWMVIKVLLSYSQPIKCRRETKFGVTRPVYALAVQHPGDIENHHVSDVNH